MNDVWLQNNKWSDVEAYLEKKKTIIIPVGSTEQHALHLPLGTDTFVARDVAEAAAELTGTLVAPPTWFGLAPHHMAYPGTITLRPETLTNLLVDMAQSLVYHGFEKIIILNGHREANLPPLKNAAVKIRNHTGAFVAVADPFYIARMIGAELMAPTPGAPGHAAGLETSHMLYLHPELCDMSKAVKNNETSHRYLNHDPFIEGDSVFVPSDVATYRERTKNIGVVGDATVSNKENGEIYHHKLVENLVELIRYCEEDVQVTLRNQNIPL
jgi:creatinine amidohydrolase